MPTASPHPRAASPTGALKLRFHAPGGEERQVHLRSRKCAIGSSAQCTLRIQAPDVRPVHCLILRGAKRTIIRSLDDNTWLNGAAFDESPLVDGDRLKIGSFEFEVLDVASMQEPRRPGRLARRPSAPPPGEAALETANLAGQMREELDSIQRERTTWNQELARVRDLLEEKTLALDQRLAQSPTSDDSAAEEEADWRANLEISIGEIQDRLFQATEEIQQFRSTSNENSASETSTSLAETADLMGSLERIEALSRQYGETGELAGELRQLRDAITDDRKAISDERSALSEERSTLSEERSALSDEWSRWREEQEQLQQRFHDDSESIEQRLERLEGKSLGEQEPSLAMEAIEELTQRFEDRQARQRETEATLAARAEKLDQRIEALTAQWRGIQQRQKAQAEPGEIDARLAGLRAEREAMEAERRPLVGPSLGEESQQEELQGELPIVEDEAGDDQPAGEEHTAAEHTVEEQADSVGPEFVGDEAPFAGDETPSEIGASEADSLSDVGQDSTTDVAQEEQDHIADEPSGVESPDSVASAPTSEEFKEEELEFQSVSSESPVSTADLLRSMGAEVDPPDDFPEEVEVTPEPSVPESKAPEPEAAAPPDVGEHQDAEDSIEDYMARLMARVRGAHPDEKADGAAEDSADDASPASTSDSGQPSDDEAEPAKVTENPAEQPRPEYFPRVPAELSTDMSAMRDLANASARGAINAHSRTRLTAALNGKLILSIVSMIAAFALMWFATTGGKPMLFYASILAMVIAIASGAQFVVLTVKKLLSAGEDDHLLDD